MSKIEWTDRTWNPVTGCTKISDGCKHCYAEPMTRRLKAMGQAKYINGFKVTCHPETLDQPLKWKKPSKIFVCSMGDLFHEDVPDEFIDKIFDTMKKCPQHIFQILTKRPERMKKHLDVFQPHLPNVWLGVTAENQEQAEKRIPLLLQTQAIKRFVSIEPMLGAVELDEAWLTGYNAGNESEDERENSLPSGFSGGTENRPERPDMEIESAESGQVDGRGKDAEMQTSKSRKRHGEILSDKDDDKREEVSCSGSSFNMVSPERSNTGKHDNKSHKRELQRQPTEQSGISNIQGTSDTFHEVFRSNIQEGQTRQILWVIVGGESGPGARPMHPDWVRKVRDDCQAAGVPFFFKQWGEFTQVAEFAVRVGKAKAGSLLDGKEYKEFPGEGAE